MTWHRGNHIAVAAQESGVACDAVHKARRATFPTSRSGKGCEWRQRERPKVYLTSEIVKDTLRRAAPLARATGRAAGAAALVLAPGIMVDGIDRYSARTSL
jgi:hypothetical protein